MQEMLERSDAPLCVEVDVDQVGCSPYDAAACVGRQPATAWGCSLQLRGAAACNCVVQHVRPRPSVLSVNIAAADERHACHAHTGRTPRHAMHIQAAHAPPRHLHVHVPRRRSSVPRCGRRSASLPSSSSRTCCPTRRKGSAGSAPRRRARCAAGSRTRVHWRLRPCALEAATLCIGGCGRVH